MEQENNNSEKIVETEKSELPMAWFKFFKYFRFPVSIVFSLFELFVYFRILVSSNRNIVKVLLLINLALLIFHIVVYYYMLAKKKKGYTLLIISLIIETITSPINTFAQSEGNIATLVVSALLWFFVWFYPNYIYFKKRKYYWFK